MNIWIFNHYAITPDLPGGTRHFDLARELVRHGYQVTIFASSFQHACHREMRLAPGERWKVEDVDGVRFVWIKTFPYQRNNWRRVLSMVSYMLRTWWLGWRLPKLSPEVEKPDVIIGSSVHLLAVLAAYLVAKRYKARFIMEVRDLWPQTLIDMGEMSERNPIVKTLQILERFLYRRAKRIIILARSMEGYISVRGASKEKIAWIPNGVNLARFESLEPRGSSNNRFEVIYLGAHGQANALDVLLQAAKILQDQEYQDTKITLIGDGPEKPKLIRLADKLGLENVEFCNLVPKADVPKTLQEADTLVVTVEAAFSTYGGSLNKLFDYMATGKPTVFSGKASYNPVKESQCGLTVPPRNPEALAEAIIKLSQMPKEEREAMGHRGREYVEKHHAIPVLADKLMECIGKGLVH